MKHALKQPVSLLIIAIFFTACSTATTEDFTAAPHEIEKFLHVPSPDWSDQILYFIVTDRFMDGDTTNNDQGEGEYKRGDGRFWNGGDLEGITQKLDYIHELGATGIWITPPVANQWRNPQKTGTGNHGYWASNFVEVDKHLGSLEDYRRLSASLHKNGMYLIQDVVVNHMGDFFTYEGPYNPMDVTENFMLHDVAQPTQYPFTLNNALDPEEREMAIFHFTPEFNDHSDSIKKRRYQFGDLDDLNTANPVVRKALRYSYNHWIGEVGVDGFRFDTPMMVEHEFWHDFIHSEDSEDPGIERYARQQGKEQFLTFGETWIPTPPFDDKGPREASRYLGTEDRPEMISVLNFPLYNAIERVFQQMQPTSVMTYRLESINRYFPQPEILLSFIDNHDGARFLTRGSHQSFRQSLLFILTVPGIPVIYYGTEQELLGMRQAMFRGGAGSPDRDYFDTDTESFLFLQELIQLRKSNQVFRKGTLKVLQDNTGGPGIFAYEIRSGETSAIILLNTSASGKFAGNIPSGKTAGTRFEALYSLTGNEGSYTADYRGNLNVRLNPGEGMVLMESGKSKRTARGVASIDIESWEDQHVQTRSKTLRGRSSGTGRIGIMMDGDEAGMIEVSVDQDGRWSADLDLGHLWNGRHRFTVLALDPWEEGMFISEFMDFDLSLEYILCGRYKDKRGDDHGPGGSYAYPAHPSYVRQNDFEEVNVYCAGSNLKVEITMAEVTRIWIPPNGFDHLLLNLYIDLPGEGGIRELPLQYAEMPGGASWDYMVSVAGFNNALYSSEGAGPDRNGKITGPAASVSTENNIITLTIASEALGHPGHLEGTGIYLTAWDGGAGSPKAIKTLPELWNYSGGSEGDPRIMDDTELIILREIR